MIYDILKIIANFLCRVLFRIEVKGASCIPKSTGFIIASNHLSYLDPIIIGAFSPRRLYFLAKSELFKNRLFGKFISYLGAIPIKRRGFDRNSLRKATNLIKNNAGLVIFPQGQRSHTLDALKNGVGFLFKRTRCKVIVARIYGTDKIIPRDKKRFSLHKVKIIFDEVKNLDPVLSYEEISQIVLEKMKILV